MHLLPLGLLRGHSLASSFTPNCTLPLSGTNYVYGPNVRSTFTIFWNCLSVILLCTWNIQHLNVPALRKEAKMFQKIWWTVLDSRTKIKWMLFTILTPEYLVGKALGEKLAAQAGVRIWSAESEFGYKEIHGYMANMGYFVLDLGDLPATQTGDRDARGETTGASENTASEPGEETAKARPLFEDRVKEALKMAMSYSARVNIKRLKHRYWALNSTQWHLVKALGIANLPQVSSRELEKEDRGEALIKAIALIQVAYLIVQLVARKIAGLPSTQLEIAALAYCASSTITYILYWSRPQGVKGVHVVTANEMPMEMPTKYNLHGIATGGPYYLWSTHITKTTHDKELDLVPIPNDACHLNTVLYHWSEYYGYNNAVISLALGAIAGGMLFGGLHCLAWNFHFPTPGEALAWKICSLITGGLPPLSIVPLIIWLQLHPRDEMEGADWLRRARLTILKPIVGVIIIVVFLVPYVLARLFLIFEIFRSMFFLPPEAFIDTWSELFPHWG
jgi:hypothetical protein